MTALPPLPATLEDMEVRLRTRTARREVAGEDWARAAVAVIVRPDAGSVASRLELLLIRRADHPLDPWSGHMAFPGGRRDPVDPDLEATAIRETLEEVGLDLASARRLGMLDELPARAGQPMRLAVTPWAFGWEGDPELRFSQEVAEALWVPLPHLVDPAHRVEHVVEREGTQFRFPGISVGDRVVWGLTLRMIEDLFEALARGEGAGP